MPAIPAMPSQSGTLNALAVYQAGIFEPANPPESFEILNGGLDSANVPTPTGFIEAWMLQYGTFAHGIYIGQDSWDFTYAKSQTSDATATVPGQEEAKRYKMQQLSATFFLPWDATAVFFFFQCLTRADASLWDSAGSPKREFWDIRTRIDGNYFDGLLCRLPHSRSTVDLPTGVTSAGIAIEERWRYVSRMGMRKDMAKGNHHLRVSTWGGIFASDIDTAKVVFPGTGIGILAIR